MKPFEELAARIRQEAEMMESRGLTGEARMARSYAEELEDAIRGFWHKELTVREAATESGCSTSKMRKMIDDGEVPQTGSRPIKVMRMDLPCYQDLAPNGRSPVADELARDAFLTSAGGR